MGDGGNSSVRNGGKRERNWVLFLLGLGVGWDGVGCCFSSDYPAFLPFFHLVSC